MRIGIVGAGMAGLACARTLATAGLDVRLFDKARGVGGRIATRRTAHGAFDHGAFAFSAAHADLRAAVDGWIARGHAARWTAPFAHVAADGTWEERAPADTLFVGVPSMNAPAKALGAHLPFERGFRVVRIDREEGGHVLHAEDGRTAGPFDRVVLALPAPQARELLPAPLAERLAAVRMVACFAVCVRYERPLELPFGAAWFADDVLASMARSRLRPGRGPEEWVTLHATATFSTPRILGDEAEPRDALLAAWRRALPVEEPPVAEVVVHRWRYALTERPLGAGSLVDPASGWAACGDWCLGSGLEAAYLSGVDLARRLRGG